MSFSRRSMERADRRSMPCCSSSRAMPTPATPAQSRGPETMSARVQKTDEEWRRELTPEQYEIMRRHGTERPWTGEHNDTKAAGAFRCAGCGAELFRSEAKFESGSGWPSFYEP